ncbi:hypothetical protein FPY71_07270 [Aureimonas fodinaquatilis]|uniref:Putative tail fiber protein gp53-like C-terminal domain-containing protein n=1 Tax=Aureimonas fodinaquatilis TaxID=2565783 RepID=A0A5B0DU31_9HYPH|nr:hypothetical protein [Aureimonas fodinaquatilis]KAA0970317.1 hypothetical protein FPY71_07270 [Aureimonas fodinaquatilis]
MSQGFLGTLEAAATSGGELAALLRTWQDAVHSQHSGAARPSYAQPGMYWLDTSTTPWVLKLFTGTVDVAITAVDPGSGLGTSLAGLVDGSVTGAKLADATIPLNKLVDLNAQRVLGRTSGSGPANELDMDALWNMIAGQSGNFAGSGAMAFPINVLGVRRTALYQWGTILGPTSDYVIAYPMAFPNGVLKPDVTMFSGGTGLVAVTCNVESVNTASFTVRRRIISNGGTVATSTIGGYWSTWGW